MSERFTSWFMWTLVLFGLWLILSGTGESAEILAGLLAGALTAAVVEASRAAGGIHFRPRGSWLRFTLRLPPHLLRDCWHLTVALWRHVVEGEPATGRFRAIAVSNDGGEEMAFARRALAIAGVSLLPNSYALGIDKEEEEERMLIHELVPVEDDEGLPL